MTNNISPIDALREIGRLARTWNFSESAREQFHLIGSIASEALRISTETTEPDADKNKYSLDGLLEGARAENAHSEFDGEGPAQSSVAVKSETCAPVTANRTLGSSEKSDSPTSPSVSGRGQPSPTPSSPSVQSIRAEALEVLEWIKRHYGNGDMNHEDFRVEVYCMALKVLENTHDS